MHIYTHCYHAMLGGSLVNSLFLSVWQKKVWQINGSANTLLIVCANLNGFSWANHRQFAKFAKLSPTELPCYMQHYSETYTTLSIQVMKHPIKSLASQRPRDIAVS